MIGKPGPFQIIENESLDFPVEPPRRRYSCGNYESCLNLAAALNWDSFTCRGCSGSVNEALCWRAQQELKKDGIVRTLCSEIPDIQFVSSEAEKLKPQEGKVLQVVGKRR